MKLTKTKLKQLIKEELGKVLSENTQVDPDDPEVEKIYKKEIYKKGVKWMGVQNETSINGWNPDDTLNTIAYYVPDLIRTGSFGKLGMSLLSDFYLNDETARATDIDKKINFIENSGHERAAEALEDIKYATNYFKNKAAMAL